MSNQNKEKKWLLKNNNQITGPFSELEIKNKIVKGHISLFTSICEPGQEFWSFIASYPEFSSPTDRYQITQFTKTLGSDFIKALSLYEATKTDKRFITGPPSPNSDEELPYKIINEIPELKGFTAKKKKKSQIFWITGSFTIFAIICVSLIFFKKHTTPHKEGKLTNFQDGHAYFLAGDYSKAMQIFKKKEKKNQLTSIDKSALQILKLQLEDDTSQGEKIINTNTSIYYTSPEEKKIIEALIQLKNGNLKSAEQSFNNLLTTKNQSEKIQAAALANLALLSVRNGKCDFFKENKKNIQLQHTNLIQFAFSMCLLKDKNLSTHQQLIVKDTLQQITNTPKDYYQEALLGLVYMNYKKEDPTISVMIKNLLDSNPYLTENHLYSIFVDRTIYSWPQLLPLCEKIYSTQKNNKLFISFYSYCLVRSKKYELAQQYIKQANSIDPKDVLVKSIHAYITNIINLKDHSALILGDAIQSNKDKKYMLPYILQARFCEKTADWECAIKYWSLILNDTPNSLPGLGGLAYAKYNQGHYTEAQEYINRSFELDPNTLYSPLLFVSTALEKKQF